jgi:uncharacterized protein YegL
MRRIPLQSYLTVSLFMTLLLLSFTGSLGVQAQNEGTVVTIKSITPSCALPGQKLTVTINISVTGGGGGGGGTAPVDVSLVMDRTGSMWGAKFSDAQDAAKAFVQSLQDQDRVDLIVFSETVQLQQDFTLTNSSGKTTLSRAIDAIISPYGYTNLYAAFQKSVQETTAKGRAVANKAIVLLTDGRPNVGETRASEFIQLAQSAVANNVRVYTIGLGGNPVADPVNASLLQDIATAGNGQYFFAPSSSQLKAIYLQIAVIIRGPPAENVRVTETLPTSIVTYDNDASQPPNSTTTDTLFWQIPLIAAGTSWSVTFTVTAQKRVAVVQSLSPTTIIYDRAGQLDIRIDLPPGMTVREVATLSIGASTTTATQGDVVNYNATIANLGLIPESIAVSLFANTTIVGHTSVNVANGASTVVGFSWNTTSASPGTYDVSITADPSGNIGCDDSTNNTRTMTLTLAPKSEGSILPFLIMILIPLAIIPIVAAALLGRRRGYGARLRLVPQAFRRGPYRMVCPGCGGPLVYYPTYGKWYCPHCGKYT